MRYNCTIIDLHDRSVVASITDRHITSELAIRTLEKAFESQRPAKDSLKNECTNLYEFRTEEELYQTVEEFAYATYNHVRPHSHNSYRTPYQARMAAISFRLGGEGDNDG